MKTHKPFWETSFWEKVERRGKNECWPWKAGTSNGYGEFGIKRRMTQAHRVAYFLTRWQMPKGREVMHLCHNKLCCNPRHLKAGTHKENVEASMKAGHYKRFRAVKRKDIKRFHRGEISLRELRHSAIRVSYRGRAGYRTIDGPRRTQLIKIVLIVTKPPH
jgi:hypothetical protein